MADWPVWLLAAIDVLAVHRLAVLVTDDVITTRPRWAIIRWAYLRADDSHDAETLADTLDAMVDADMGEDPLHVPRAAVLVRCRWCCSPYLAALVVAAHTLAPTVWLPLAAVLALSSASTLLARLED